MYSCRRLVYVVSNPFVLYYHKFGRQGPFLLSWHRKHKLTHKQVRLMLFGERQQDDYEHRWKLWQRKLPAKSWSSLVDTTAKLILKSDSPKEKAIMEELRAQLLSWPTSDELHLFTDRALKSRKQAETEELLRAVNYMDKQQLNATIRAGSILDEYQRGLDAVVEQIKAERARVEPHALRIAGLERERIEYTARTDQAKRDLENENACYDAVQSQKKRLNAHLLSLIPRS